MKHLLSMGTRPHNGLQKVDLHDHGLFDHGHEAAPQKGSELLHPGRLVGRGLLFLLLDQGHILLVSPLVLDFLCHSLA